ncbi:AcrR family transcriptional regulator [Isoptericola halotolerans]|uniref:AcrR family transcriptional regulator n=2 Tax=Isoptericola halotolerans TaxID=300560 RepID=A0ABX2A384_9MICO|nr:AcrR family transcriptional regulator [Isoptericola halotolerans]
MATVARTAGLAPATLYRHFPSRAALTAAVFTGDLEGCATLVEEALADTDPRRGLVMLLDEVAKQQIQNRAFADAFLGQAPALPAFDALRRRTLDLLGDLVRRAKASGGLREDFSPGDVFVMLYANRGFAAMPQESAERASNRLTALFIEACFIQPRALQKA